MRRSLGPRSERFLRELKTYCQAEEGRAVRLAEYLGCRPGAVYGWWRLKERFPTTEQLLAAQEWLEKSSK